MKAFKIAMFLILVNGCLLLFSSASGGVNIYPAGENGLGTPGAGIVASDEAFSAADLEYTNQPDAMTGSWNSIFSSPWSLAFILAGVFIAGAGGLSVKLTTPQVVGIILFALLFWSAWGATSVVLDSLELPALLVIILHGMHWWVFIAAIIQMCTGTSFDNMT